MTLRMPKWFVRWVSRRYVAGSTLDDAVRTLANSDIEYLYLPEYQKLVTLKN